VYINRILVKVFRAEKSLWSSGYNAHNHPDENTYM